MNRIYPHLSDSFIRGKWPGQLDSAWKDRRENPDKARQYLQAICNGDAQPPPTDMTRRQREKWEDLLQASESARGPRRG